MDWQQVAALTVVAVTSALFLRARWRRRSGRLPCGAGCGCAGAASPPRESIVYRARKGARPEIIVKLR